MQEGVDSQGRIYFWHIFAIFVQIDKAEHNHGTKQNITMSPRLW